MKSFQRPFVSEIISKHSQRTKPDEIRWAGHKFLVYQDVFSPFIAPSGLITKCLACTANFSGKSVWEVGCGSGLFSCSAALSGATNVLATDISSSAVNNTKENVKTMGVEDIVSVRHGNLFDPVNQNDIFDLVYVDLPLVDRNADSFLERAFYEPNLNSLKNLPKQLRNCLNSRHSEVYVCLSNFGSKQEILDVFRENHFNAERVLKMEMLSWITLELYKFEPFGAI